MKIIPILSDTHTNSTVALMPNIVRLEDGQEVTPSVLQWKIKARFDNYVATVMELQRKYGAEIITVWNGDVSDGDHHNTSQIFSRNTAVMDRMVIDTLHPLVDSSSRNIVTRGTQAHSGAANERDETFGELIKAVQDEETGSYSHWHLRLTVEGVRFDIAHHGNMGKLPWTRHNAANKLAATVIAQYAEAYEEPPHLAIRSHQHRHADSYTNLRTRGIFLPCWQGPTGYIKMIDPVSTPHIGGIIVLVHKGKFRVIDKVSKFKMKPAMEITL